MSSSFGQVFRISTWGESHGTGVGVVIDGCPSLVPVMEEDIQRELDRRRPGQSDIVTPRREEDRAEILSGVLDGKTLGTPIAISVRNKDHRSSAYDEMASTYRPSHADYTYDAKYGIRAWAGGGRASARETIGRVAAGAVARAVLKQAFPDMEVIAWVDQVHHVKASVDWEAVTASVIESNIVRTADSSAAEAMIAAIKEARDSGNSLGGVVKCVVRGCPPGLGDPVFDKLDATLAHAMMSIPATKAFAVGSGFEAAGMTGLELFMNSGKMPEGDYVADVWTTQQIIVDMSGMMDGNIGYSESWYNPELSKWLKVDTGTMPPLYSLSHKVYAVRLPDGTDLALKLSNYMDATGVKGYMTIDYVYPVEF